MLVTAVPAAMVPALRASERGGCDMAVIVRRGPLQRRTRKRGSEEPRCRDVVSTYAWETGSPALVQAFQDPVNTFTLS